MIEKDLYVESFSMPPRIDLPQGTNVQKMKFFFQDLKPEGTPRLYAKKPSGFEIYNDAEEYDFDADVPYVIFKSTTQLTAEAGKFAGQVRVTTTDSILNSFPVTFNIVESPDSENAVESKDEFTALDEALEKVQPAIDALNETNEDVKEAESLRVTAEQGRVSAEQGRVTAEAARVSAEQGRVTAEQGRVTAENERVSEFNQMKQEVEDAEITATASTGDPGSSVIVQTTGTGLNKNFAFTIPRGDKGDPGDPGTIATASQLGVVMPSTGLSIDTSGKLSVKPATPSTLGGVIVQSSDSSGLELTSAGGLSVSSALQSFAGTGRTYYTTGDPMTVTVDMNNRQIIAPCTIINPNTGVIVVDDGL